MNLKIAQFINIMLLALVAGVFWGTWFTLGQSITSFAPETFLAIGKAIIQNIAPIMPILVPVAILSTLPVLYFIPQKKSWAFYLTLASLLLIVVATFITVFVEVPIDNQVKQWTVASLPSDWQAIRDRWELFHTIRTFTALASLAFILAGTLASYRSPITHQPAI